MLLGHLKWLRQGKLDPGILLHIFDTMVKPIFEYNAEIWVHNINKPILAMLERIQLRFWNWKINTYIGGTWGTWTISHQCRTAD